MTPLPSPLPVELNAAIIDALCAENERRDEADRDPLPFATSQAVAAAIASVYAAAWDRYDQARKMEAVK